MCAGIFPLIHMGRPWLAFWMVPYPNTRGPLWVNFKSPLVWDVFAVTTYFTVSAVFFYLGCIPDVAAARDRASGLRRKLYTIISMGWQGTDRQWHHFGKAYIFLAALAANALSAPAPLGIFRRFLVERNGEHRDSLDLKSWGLTVACCFQIT